MCIRDSTSACDDCVVAVVLGMEPGPLELNGDEAAALDHLADAGLVAPLRLVSRFDGRETAAG